MRYKVGLRACLRLWVLKVCESYKQEASQLRQKRPARVVHSIFARQDATIKRQVFAEMRQLADSRQKHSAVL